MTEDSYLHQPWSESESSGQATYLYSSFVSLLRSSSSSVNDPVNQTQQIYNGTIRDGPHGFFLACSIMLSIVGTIMNTLAIMTICSMSTRALQDATHTFVLNLSIADLLLSMFVIPTHWLQIVFRKVTGVGDLLCSISQLSFFWMFEVSLFTLSVVSVNRMIKICYNTSYPHIFTKNTIQLLISLLWTFSFLLVLPPYFGIYGTYEIFEATKASGKYYCGLANSSKSMISPSAFYYTIGFFVPFLAIPFSYWKIFRKVREHRAHFRASNSDARNYKLFQTITVIFVSFVICYLPNMILRGWMPYTARFKYLRQLVKALMYGNTVLNPIIYFTMNTEYQNAYYRMLNKHKRRFNFTSIGVNKGPDSKSSDQETVETPVERVGDAAMVEGGGTRDVSGTRMTASNQARTTKTLVMSYSAIISSLLIFCLIADFIRHRRLPAHVLEMQRRELAELD